jgi:hypothetical protein
MPGAAASQTKLTRSAHCVTTVRQRRLFIDSGAVATHKSFWSFSNAFLHQLAGLQGDSTWDLPDWSQSIFSSSVPRKFSLVSRLWSLLRGLTMWCIWTTWINKIFNQQPWNSARCEVSIWNGRSEYAQAAWAKMLGRITKDPTVTRKALKKFDSKWGHFHLLCIRKGKTVSWINRNPVSNIG